MLDLFRAEWAKINGNRWVAGCLIWIFPISALTLVVIIGVVMAFSETVRTSYAAGNEQWTSQLVDVWGVPNNPLGRLLLIGFAAVIFAGEYQWNTWKNVVPRNRRLVLLLTKFITLGVFVVFAFVTMSIIMAVGTWLLVLIAGGTYGPPVTAEVVRDVAGDYTRSAGLAFVSMQIAAGYASLAAMLTHSILGGVLVGFGATLVEGLSAAALSLIAFFLEMPGILELYRFTPTYNLLNVNEWIVNDKSLAIRMDIGPSMRVVLSDSLAFSVLMLAAWVIGLITVTAIWFQRQDITS